MILSLKYYHATCSAWVRMHVDIHSGRVIPVRGVLQGLFPSEDDTALT